ncbi:MAG: hypothetical protein M3Z24_11740 [Chloroflexota bacterium]|nr:hypothetical protein [Chloroflexota bacterium]
MFANIRVAERCAEARAMASIAPTLVAGRCAEARAMASIAPTLQVLAIALALCSVASSGVLCLPGRWKRF